MIVDKLANFDLYTDPGSRIAKAFAYVNETDLLNTDLGKYEIENNEVFAIVQEYYTKDKQSSKLEGHKKYIDIQYVIDGEELIGYAPLTDQNTSLVNSKEDYTLYDGQSDFVELKKGMFAVLFPDDLHMPGIKIVNSMKVKKVVVKVKIQ